MEQGSLIASIIDITLTSILIYTIYYFFRGTYTAAIAKGIILVIVAYIISSITGLNTINWIFLRFLNDFPLIVVVIFHQEIRQFFSNIGRPHYKNLNSSKFTDNLINSLKTLSENNIGALIILEGTMKLNDIINSGIIIDSRFTPELIHSIFCHGSPLHDGAVVVRDEKIFATKVFIPTAFHSTSIGTRHNAALSISKERDCTVYVVSEETGGISYARDGILTPIPNIIIEEIIYETIK